MTPGVLCRGSRAAAARRLGLVSLIVAVGTTLSAAWHYILGAYLDFPFPANTFLYDPNDRFNDFLNCVRDVRTFSAASGGVRSVYTPLMHMILAGLVAGAELVRASPEVLLVAVIAAFCAMFVGFLARFFTLPDDGRIVNARRVLILCGLSFPVLILLDRANLEMLVFGAVLGFVYFYYVKPTRWLWIAFLVLAGGMKVYPLALLLIPLSDRRFRDCLYVLLGAAATTTIAFVALGAVSGYGFPRVLGVWLSFTDLEHAVDAAIGWMGIHHGHSLWGVAYFVDVLLGKPFAIAQMRPVYVALTIVAAAFAAAWLYLGRLEPWQKLTVAVFVYLLLPFSSHDYTLVHVYLPLALFVWSGDRQRFDTALTFLFAALLIPLDYYYFMQDPGVWPSGIVGSLPILDAASWARLNGISTLLYPAIMVAILGLIAQQSRNDPRTLPG